MEPGIYITIKPKPEDIWPPGWCESMTRKVWTILTVDTKIKWLKQATHSTGALWRYHWEYVMVGGRYYRPTRVKQIASIK